MSSFAWLDYSDRERQQVMEVIDLFREEDTRDELGVGTIRDTLADLLFPGTSTIQTRLRYFLFVPWVMTGLERRRVASQEAGVWSRRSQGRLCEALKASETEKGIIGALAGQHVQRLPSNVYWSGLGIWGIRLYSGSEMAYYQSLNGFYERQRTSRGSSDSELGKEPVPANWDPELPAPPDELMDNADFRLTEVEADYLVDRVRRRAPDSLLRELIDRGAMVDDDAPFAWDHPGTGDLPPPLAETLEHAQNFSQLIHGAALLYNLILAEQTEWKECIENYRSQLAMWWDGTVQREEAFEAWDQRAFWRLLVEGGARVTPHTRSFVDTWWDLFGGVRRLEDLVDNQRARELVRNREQRLKGKRARIDNQAMLENWRGASGSAQLDYRWNRPVAGYLNDLAAALSGDDADA